jgi:hypothetical protein
MTAFGFRWKLNPNSTTIEKSTIEQIPISGIYKRETALQKYYWLNSGSKVNLEIKREWQLGFLQRQKCLSPG